MNLQNVLAVVGIALFIVSIVRGCGGMMSAGCGMGSRAADERPHDQQERTDKK